MTLFIMESNGGVNPPCNTIVTLWNESFLVSMNSDTILYLQKIRKVSIMIESIKNKGREYISLKIGISKEFLYYIGYTDCSVVKPGAKLFQFNVMDKNHERYKSTVGYKYGF